MLIIDSPSNDAYFNIASEEYLLQRFPDETIFLLYVNAPSIIVGKYQNTLAEINLDYVTDKKIKVVRRMTGGGAVYHDTGNLNFSFHTPFSGGDFSDFSTFTNPVIRLLNDLGVPARLEGRNDLLVDGKKFSGNAKTIKSGKMIQHGTILIHSEMSVLSDSLKVNPLKFTDKAIKSTRARVTNLIDYLPEGTTTESFKNLLIEQVIKESPDAIIYTLSAKDLAEIEHLAEEKYRTWDWNYGSSPAYNYKKAQKYAAGFIELHLDVEKGVIQRAKLFGDFFASGRIEDLEEILIGEKHAIAHLSVLLENTDLQPFFGNITTAEFLELFR